MTAAVVAMTEGERVALIAGLLAIAAGVPGAAAAVIAARTRRENADQHGSSQRKLDEVRDAVIGQGVKLDEVRDDVRDVAAAVDRHEVALALHEERLGVRGRRGLGRLTRGHRGPRRQGDAR